MENNTILKSKELLDTIREKMNNELDSLTLYTEFCTNQDLGIFDNIESFENGYNVKPIKVIKGINIYYMPTLMVAVTAEVAITLHLFDDSVIIIVDDIFSDMFNNKEKWAVICHEIGHIVDGDNTTDERKKEFIADKYAAECVNTSSIISAISKIRDILEYLYGNSSNLLLLDERIEKIKNSR